MSAPSRLRPVFHLSSRSAGEAGPERPRGAERAVRLLFQAISERRVDLVFLDALGEELDQLVELALGALQQLSLTLHLGLRRRVSEAGRGATGELQDLRARLG